MCPPGGLTGEIKEFLGGAVGSAGQRHVGVADVEQVRHLARMFASEDHMVGGGWSSQAVVAQLHTSAELLHGRFFQETVRQHFFSAVAELSDIAGGMCFDAGSHQQTERCFRFAVACATEGDDWAMRCKALSGLSNLAVHQGRTDDALSFSEMALVRADRLTPLVRAVMHTRHARALGLSGGGRLHGGRTPGRRPYSPPETVTSLLGSPTTVLRTWSAIWAVPCCTRPSTVASTPMRNTV